tara:strand:- start:802 stop:1131 length:330 start_codon:yes stop_codon:yes gene_type:complete
MEAGAVQQQTLIVPHAETLISASKLAIQEDKPIKLDFYVESMQCRCRLVKNQQKENLLFKSDDEYTSPIRKLFQIDSSQTSDGHKDIICVTENSIYIINNRILQQQQAS